MIVLYATKVSILGKMWKQVSISHHRFAFSCCRPALNHLGWCCAGGFAYTITTIFFKAFSNHIVGKPPPASLYYLSYFKLCNTFLIRSIRCGSTKCSPSMQLLVKPGSASQLWLHLPPLMLLQEGKRRDLWRRDWIRSLLTRWKWRKEESKCSNPDRFVPSVCWLFLNETLGDICNCTPFSSLGLSPFLIPAVSIS